MRRLERGSKMGLNATRASQNDAGEAWEVFYANGDGRVRTGVLECAHPNTETSRAVIATHSVLATEEEKR